MSSLSSNAAPPTSSSTSGGRPPRSSPMDALLSSPSHPSISVSPSLQTIFSPSNQIHPCQERLFPEDTEEQVVFLRGGGAAGRAGGGSGDDGPGSSEGGVSHERLLARASMTGSIHELQEETGAAISAVADDATLSATLASMGMAADDDLSNAHPSAVKDPAASHSSEDDDETFEDAVDELSPQRRRTSPEKTAAAASAVVANDDVAEVAESAGAAAESVIYTPAWRQRRKHLFILSEAGKPIFSLHGDEDELASLTAVMQALVSYVVDMNDSLRSFNVDGGIIVFLNKSPLILVAVSRGMESVTQLIVQLTYLYNQILSVVTLSMITSIFEHRKGFDLRRTIAGSERLLASLSRAMDDDPCFMLSAVRVLPMPVQSRDAISTAVIQACGKINSVVFAMLIAENQLITLVRMKKYFIHPADLHLVLNLVNSTESFKMSETWTPICLPKFDAGGFLHAHISYLSDTSPACLIMLTVDKEIFSELSEAKNKIVLSLEKQNSTQAISDGLNKSSYTADSIGIQIRHFLYKAKTAAQFTMPKLSHPYKDEESRFRLHGMYLQIQNRLHSISRPLRLMYVGGQHENVLGWITQSFELYASFAPATPKASAIEAINKLLKWCKKEEQTLFILNAPTF